LISLVRNARIELAAFSSGGWPDALLVCFFLLYPAVISVLVLIVPRAENRILLHSQGSRRVEK